MVEPVTRPDKIVTDPLVLRQLARQGIDHRFVKFIDYGARGLGVGPFMKGYDLGNGQFMSVVSGLPMCNAQGQKIDPSWTLSGGLYLATYNLFDTTVDKARVTIVCQADQPNGTKQFDGITYHPQLFIGGSEVHPVKKPAQLLEVDPINQNYLYNTLEWDYGVCKRRIRVIQGRFRERWIFSANPNADVRIKHNFSGNLRLKLGSAIDASGMPLRVLVIGDEEIISVSEFAKATFPVQIGASLTVYPDTNAAGVDGQVARNIGAGDTWAAIRDGAGTYAADDLAQNYCHYTISDDENNKWQQVRRAPLVLDCSDLGAGAIVSAATLSLYGWVKSDSGGWAPTTNIYACNPASNTALIAADFNIANWGSTPYCDSVITYAGWNDAGYNAFVYNATGIAAIPNDDVHKVGTRNANYDVADSPPTWAADKAAGVGYYGVEEGAGYKPKLVVTYTIPVPTPVDGDLIGIPIIKRS